MPEEGEETGGEDDGQAQNGENRRESGIERECGYVIEDIEVMFIQGDSGGRGHGLG